MEERFAVWMHLALEAEKFRMFEGPRRELAAAALLLRRLEPQVAINDSPVERTSIGILKPNSRIDEHILSTAASFLRGLRTYKTNLSMGQIWISIDSSATFAFAGSSARGLNCFFISSLSGSLQVKFARATPDSRSLRSRTYSTSSG